MTQRLIPAILVLALASLACSVNVDMGPAPEPGPAVVDEITVPAPEGDSTRLLLSFGAGEMYLSPGADDRLVEGTATYNLRDFKPEVSQTGSEVRIRQGDYEFGTAPTLRNLKNVWDLQLGDAPMDLAIQAGAYQGRMELGGLALTGLTVEDGAADVELSFSSPNRAEMSVFRYQTGASSVTLEGLANANFNTLIFDSGAGDYTLDFSGDLQRDAIVTIDSGLSNVTLIVPDGLNAAITLEGGLTNVNADSSWSRGAETYTQNGDGPELTIVIRMSAGNLTLTD
jgi:hypothetical protein